RHQGGARNHRSGAQGSQGSGGRRSQTYQGRRQQGGGGRPEEEVGRWRRQGVAEVIVKVKKTGRAPARFLREDGETRLGPEAPGRGRQADAQKVFLQIGFART